MSAFFYAKGWERTENPTRSVGKPQTEPGPGFSEECSIALGPGSLIPVWADIPCSEVSCLLYMTRHHRLSLLSSFWEHFEKLLQNTILTSLLHCTVIASSHCFTRFPPQHKSGELYSGGFSTWWLACYLVKQHDGTITTGGRDRHQESWLVDASFSFSIIFVFLEVTYKPKCFQQ